MKEYVMSCYATKEALMEDMRKAIVNADEKLKSYLEQATESYNKLWDRRCDMLKQEQYNENDLTCISETIKLLKGRIEATEFAISLL